MYKNMIPADVFARETHLRERAPCDSGTTGMAALEQQAKEARERYLKVSADFENYKRRSAQEMEVRCAVRKEAFIRDLLPVFDNLQRALANSARALTSPLRAGLEMTFRQFLELMRSHGLEPHGEVGERFDPNFHEAVWIRTDPRCLSQSIVEVWQCGWMHNGKLFRAAKVVVNDLAAEALEPMRERKLEMSPV